MGALTTADKEKIKRVIPKASNKIIDATVARLYIAYPDKDSWTYTGLSGAIVFCDDLVGHTFFLKLVDIIGNRGVLWDQELYVNFEYNQDRTFFHSFEIDDCYVGLLFEDLNDASHFLKKIKNRSKHGSKLTNNNKNAILLKKTIKQAPATPGPRGVESDQRVRRTKGPLFYDGLPPPEWRSLYSELEQAGITEEMIADNREFIKDYISKQGGPLVGLEPPIPRKYQYKHKEEQALPSPSVSISKLKKKAPPPPPSKLLQQQQTPQSEEDGYDFSPPESYESTRNSTPAPISQQHSSSPSPSADPSPAQTPQPQHRTFRVPPPMTFNNPPPSQQPPPQLQQLPNNFAPQPPQRLNMPLPLQNQFGRLVPPPPPARGAVPPPPPSRGAVPLPPPRNAPQQLPPRTGAMPPQPPQRTGAPPPPPPRRGNAPPPPPSRGAIPPPPPASQRPILQPPSAPPRTLPQQQPPQSFAPPPQRTAVASPPPIAPPLPQQQQQQQQPPVAPPMPQANSTGGPPPPPPLPQMSTGLLPPPPPPMPQMDTSAPTINEATGDVGRDALLASIRGAGVGALKKVDKSQLDKPSALLQEAKGEPILLPPSSSGGGVPGQPATLADALSAALAQRKGKVGNSDDEDDEGDW